MSLIIHRTDPYDDKISRQACIKYCYVKQWIVYENNETARIDVCARKQDGKVLALELQCNSCWIDTPEYPEEHIHVPSRKFDYFREAIWGIPTDGREYNIAKCDAGYLMLFNVSHTRAGILKFDHLLRSEKAFEEIEMNLNNDLCVVKLVPVSYIRKYIDIPQ